MKKAFPLVASTALAIALASSLSAAQSGIQGTQPPEKNLTAYKSPNGNQSNSNEKSGSPDDKPAGDSNSEAQKFYDYGMNLFNEGKLDDAINAFKQAAKLR